MRNTNDGYEFKGFDYMQDAKAFVLENHITDFVLVERNYSIDARTRSLPRRFTAVLTFKMPNVKDKKYEVVTPKQDGSDSIMLTADEKSCKSFAKFLNANLSQRKFKVREVK